MAARARGIAVSRLQQQRRQTCPCKAIPLAHSHQRPAYLPEGTSESQSGAECGSTAFEPGARTITTQTPRSNSTRERHIYDAANYGTAGHGTSQTPWTIVVNTVNTCGTLAAKQKRNCQQYVATITQCTHERRYEFSQDALGENSTASAPPVNRLCNAHTPRHQ